MEGGGRVEVTADVDELAEIFCFLELDGREDRESFCFLEGTLGIVGTLGEGWEEGRKEEVELNEIFKRPRELVVVASGKENYLAEGLELCILSHS